MTQISQHFNSVTDNMQCPCCNAFIFEQAFINRVEVLRKLMNVPFNLDKRGGGFYRCRLYQESVGGVKNSQHTLGNAMDVLNHGWDAHLKWKFIKEATALGLSIGIYSTFFHVDFRGGNPVTWLG